MTYFTYFFLDQEKDIIVNLYLDCGRMFYVLETPNHKTGNLIRNLAAVGNLPLSEDESGRLVIRGEVPCYINGENEEEYILHIGSTKIADIYADGRVILKASIPSISKTLMSQTKDYRQDLMHTVFKTYIRQDVKFRTDLHTHMNGNLSPDILIALGIRHQIRYPYYYVKKLQLALSPAQKERAEKQRKKVAKQFVDSGLKGKYLDRKIDDNTFLNFADLILNNLDHAEENIVRIRTSLAILKDGQAVFTNLEKVYLYRYVFCKGKESEEKIRLHSIDLIPDKDVCSALKQMLRDAEHPDYHTNTIFQNKLLWIARSYQKQGICYAEISDTTLVKKYESLQMLEEVHQVMPAITKETGVLLRFLAALRRIPLTIVKDQVTPENYLQKNLTVLKAVARDPYVAGCDFVGEEINDILELKPLFREIVKIPLEIPDFVIRVHAGENDSQKDNIAHSIACVKDSLAPGQEMPHMRIGHGLYTYSLRSKKGQSVLKELKENHVVLEFQLTSNVRLNNLNSVKYHPIKEYLEAGLACVQGTDGAALYGTNAMDEQLSLTRFLKLSHENLTAMKEAETRILENGMASFERKSRELYGFLNGRTPDDAFLELMEMYELEAAGKEVQLPRSKRLDSTQEFEDQIRELPWDRMPVVLAGGSFNSEKRATRMSQAACRKVQELLDSLDPDEVFFVIGDRMQGYEKYLTEHNEKNFRIYAIVPSRMGRKETETLKGARVSIRVSTESEAMGIYKSFNYEIFERRPSVLVAFDGNSAAENLIQEARNGKGKSAIFVWEDAKTLREKAESLEGYVRFFSSDTPIGTNVQEWVDRVGQETVKKED